MKTLFDEIKSIQKKNEKLQKPFGLNFLQELTEAVSKQTEIQNNLSGLSGLRDITKTVSQQMRSINTTSAMLGSNLNAQINAIQYPKNNYALSRLTSTLAEIAKSNQQLSDKLSGLAASQLLLSNNLSQLAKSLSQTHLNKFNSIDIALKGLSNAYLKDIARSRSWENFTIAEEANEVIVNASDELLNEHEQVEVEDLYNLKQSIVGELNNLLSKTKTEKARQFIFELIAIISFLLSFYSVNQQQSDLSNKKVVEKTKTEVEHLNKEFSKKIETELQKLEQTRIARTNVNLRYADKKNSKIIGLVKKGQSITVIEIRHKFILISYIDMETGEPKSGFAIKKYFEK